jgi:hypothetical protein
MPNWCSNWVTVTGKKTPVNKFMKLARNHVEKGLYADLSLSSLYPIPEEEKSNWYDWSIKNWGTKWDVDGVLSRREDTSLLYTFSSAWCPPCEAFVEISRKFPTLEFDLEWFEGGMGFLGRQVIKNGRSNSLVEYTWSDLRELKILAANNGLGLEYSASEADVQIEIWEEMEKEAV